MDGSSPAGNPSAPSSQPLPAAGEERPQPADWSSVAEDHGRRSGDRSARQSRCRTRQRPEEAHQNPEEAHQNPEEAHQNPEEAHQSPEETHKRLERSFQISAETHLNPEEPHQNPEEAHQSPEEAHQRLERSRQSPADAQQNPEVTHQNPDKTHQSPVKTHHRPQESRQSSAEAQQNPEVTRQNPEVTHQNPEETHQNQEETHQNPEETHHRPQESRQSSAEAYQNPEETHRNPEETHHRLEGSCQSSAEAQQNPEETHQNPEETHQSPVKTHQRAQASRQSSADAHQNPAETQQSPEKTHRGPTEAHLNPPETEHHVAKGPHSVAEAQLNPTQTLQSPAEAHLGPPETEQQVAEAPHSLPETQLNPAETHQSPTEAHQNLEETPQSREEAQLCPAETSLNPSGTHQCPAETHHDPAETQQSLVEAHQSPAEIQQNSAEGACLLDLTKHHHDPPTGQQRTKNSLSLKDQPRPEPVSTAQQEPGDSFPTDQLNPEGPDPEASQKDICVGNHRTEPLAVSTHKPNQEPNQFEDRQNCQSPAETPTETTPVRHYLNTQQAPPITMDSICDQVWPRPPELSSEEPKLCGFLQKQGGPLRAWKQRWFTYEEKKNQLFYYRTPQDVTPLGRVELSGATFTYPLKAERGTFHIKTPERTFILKAVTQELMLYWLQQLQVKRWQHRQAADCPDTAANNNNNNSAPDNFLPMLKSPMGLVGEEAANAASPRAPLANMSIKHPLIEIQNSVHCLRKRSSQEWSQSVFHVEAPPWTPPNTAASVAAGAPADAPTLSSPLPLADPAEGRHSPAEGRHSPTLFDGQWRKKKGSLTGATILRRDTLSSDRASRLQQDKRMLMEEVKAQKELVWLLHKALEAAQLEKRTCAEFVAADGEQERLELLRHRERQAADLRGRLEEARAETEAARRSLAERDAQVADLQENVRMLVEKNNAKQEVIIKLSDQVTACMSEPPQSGGGGGANARGQLQQHVENLKDDIEAYKTQNKFLNSEIYQLTKLWRTSSEQEKSLMVKCSNLEASNCQVESRYLGVLRKLQASKSLDAVQQGAIQKVIENALKGEVKDAVKLGNNRDHDEYGFKIIPDYEVEDMKLLAKIQALEIRSHNLLQQEGGERPLLSRWAQYLAGRSDGDLCPSPELKGLMRAGVPPDYRQRVWRWVVRARTRTTRERHPGRYQELCEKSRTSPHPASRQIQLDLHRTLTTNRHFSSPCSPALQQLRQILLAFSWQNPAIGYCQGLNRLAAIALLVLQSEEDAFWCLVSVVETIMPQDYYTKDLVASQADQWVFKDFLAEKLPRLAAHFEDHDIDVSLITFNWFLVVFVESLPSDILLPLWDAFLYEGTKVIFRYALALFKYKEDDILKIQDSVEIYQYLRFFTKTISDGRRLIGIAFGDMNPFPGRLLRNRRALHLERLQGELRELEEQQREFVTETPERKDKELDTMVSEDDEEL